MIIIIIFSVKKHINILFEVNHVVKVFIHHEKPKLSSSASDEDRKSFWFRHKV